MPISSRPSVETIPTSPNVIIQLNIEEIPPIEVLYSPQHKDILKKSGKKRKVIETQFLTITTTMTTPSLEVVWKGTLVSHEKELKEFNKYS